jgi:branched-chain amino acid transport system permease protein
MLTLAFAQIVWAAATQWQSLTGGDDGILGVWPGTLFNYYWIMLALSAAALWLLRRAMYAPFGHALRAARDASARAESIGLDAHRLRTAAFTLAGAAAGLAGGLFAFAKGSVFPTYVSLSHSVDALLMVLLGGAGTISGPIAGAVVYTGAYDGLLQLTQHWRLALGAAIIVLVLGFPGGLGGKAPR